MVIGIINFEEAYPTIYHKHYELISKFNVGLKTLLREDLSEAEFYSDLVYKFMKLKERDDFSFLFRKIITCYRHIGYNLKDMRQSACVVFNPIMNDSHAAFLNCTSVDWASDSMMAPTKAIYFSRWDRSFVSVAWLPGFNCCFSFAPDFSKIFGAQRSPRGTKT